MNGFSPVVLPELLDNASNNYPSHGFGFVHPHHGITFCTFPEMRSKALSLLAALQARGMNPGAHIILSLDKAEEIIPALWACFYGGMIPALIQPPFSFTESNPAAEKALKVYQVLGSPGVILSHAHAKSWHDSNIPDEKLFDIAGLHGREADARTFRAQPAQLALIQFSSGSTGNPKGVMLTHENILVNTADIIRGIQLTAEDVSVNWMPLYHDMGLIGFHITPVFAGVDQYFINPVDFVKNPFLWLDIMTAKKCTISACPNFGQVLVNRHLSRKPSKTWDLSPLRVLFNGAEPISVTTMRTFLDSLSDFRLRSVAMLPAYGLAEATLAVTFPDIKSEVRVISFNRQKLIGEGIAETALHDAIELVDLGKPLDHNDLMIVDNRFHPVPENVTGNVWVKGKNVTGGYFANSQMTLQSFHKEWLLTGDIGFIYEGSLFITGRSKDIIFINGMNYYAHDIEHIICQLDSNLNGRAVVSGIFNEQEGRDQLLIFLVSPDHDDAGGFCKLLKNHLSNHIGINPDLFILIRSSDIPRTSSGKIQRYKLVERFRLGNFTRILTI